MNTLPLHIKISLLSIARVRVEIKLDKVKARAMASELYLVSQLEEEINRIDLWLKELQS